MDDSAGLARYNPLPEAVRCTLTFEQYQWLPQREKDTMVQDLTEPEIEL